MIMAYFGKDCIISATQRERDFLNWTRAILQRRSGHGGSAGTSAGAGLDDRRLFFRF